MSTPASLARRMLAGVDAAGVVRVEVDRHADLVPQRLHQRVGRVRLAQAGHVLDGQDVRPHLHQLLGHLARSTPGCTWCAWGRGCRRCSRWRPRRWRWCCSRTASIATFMLSTQFSESKMRKTSMPWAAAALVNSLHDVVGVVGVPDGVAGPQQHLEQDVGDLDAQLVEPVPRVFLEEPHGRVERGPAPHLQAEQVAASRCATASAICSRSYVRTRVASSDWWASRIVVSVNSSRFCLRTHSAEFLRPQFQQLVPQCPAAAGCPRRTAGTTGSGNSLLRVRPSPSPPAGR